MAITAVLGDFAPALRLLPEAERSRARALGGYTSALFERARSGDDRQDPLNRRARLESIERLVDALDESLAGLRGVGSAGVGELPAPVRSMEIEHRRHPWPRAALDELATASRHRATTPRLETRREWFSAALRFSAALACAQLGSPQPPEVARFAAALVRLSMLQNLGAELDAGRCPLSIEELPAEGEKPDLRAVVAAVRYECSRLRPDLLAVGKALPTLPGAYQRATTYLLLAGLRLLADLEDADSLMLTDPPRLGPLTRTMLLLKARRGAAASLAE